MKIGCIIMIFGKKIQIHWIPNVITIMLLRSDTFGTVIVKSGYIVIQMLKTPRYYDYHSVEKTGYFGNSTVVKHGLFAVITIIM